jgi:DNA-binding CsgD family transcriptional regulator/tetratricopeptide (TPR) repeat protein
MPGMTTGGGGSERFVGREREVGVIVGALRDAAAGTPGSLFLTGPSGVGASRLIDEAVARLAADHDSSPAPTILRGDGLPAWRGAPYGPVRVALEGLLGSREPAEILRLLGPGADLLLPLLPGIAARFPDPPAGPASRERLAERTQEAVRAVLGRLAVEGPVVVVLEDLHVLDAATRALLAFLARTLGDRPILLLGSYQPDALGRGHPLRATFEAIDGGPRPARRLELAPLDRSALRALIEAHEGEPPSAPVLLLVAERSAGSPLVAEEVLAARRELSGASLSSPLEQLVVARAVRHSRECRRVLRALAVADGPVTPAELAAIVAAFDEGQERPAPRTTAARRRGHDGLDPDLAAGVDEALAAGFATRVGPPGHGSGRRPGRRVADERPVRIRHELIAAALAADLLPGSRRRMHAAVARALEQHPAEAARHWHRVHEAGQELAAATAAATEAELAGAAIDALAQLERAIEVAGAPAAAGTIGAADELDLLPRAAEAASGAGETGRAVAFVELALAHLPDARDRPARAALTERLGGYLAAGGDRKAAFAAYERALELLPPLAAADRSRILSLLAQLRMLEGSFTEAERLAEEAIRAAEEAGPDARAWLGHATCTRGVVDGWLGRNDASIERLELALAIAMDLGRLEDAFRARANLTTALDLQGRREEAVEVARQGIAAAMAAGLEVVHGNALRGNAAEFLVSLGRWREAREQAQRALDWAPSGFLFVNAALRLATVEAETTAGDAAVRLLGRVLLELETVPDVQFAAPAYQVAASLALWRGDLADAVRSIEAAWARVRASEDWAIAARTAAAGLAVADARARVARERRDLADLAGARAWADDVLRHATRMVEQSGAPADTWVRREVEADLATARAYAARLHGRDDPAAWEAVAARWEALRRPYEQAKALLRLVEAVLEAGHPPGERRTGRDEAREPLLRAAGIATDLGALPLLRALADLAGRARIALPEAVLAVLTAGDAQPAAPPAEGPEAPPRTARTRRSDAAGDADRRTAASFGLSAREQDVLAEIVAGRTNRQIGERLFISEKTVGVHVGNILAKLGVGGRVEAATVALRLGLVDRLAERTKKPGPGGPGFSGRRRGGAA